MVAEGVIMETLKLVLAKHQTANSYPLIIVAKVTSLCIKYFCHSLISLWLGNCSREHAQNSSKKLHHLPLLRMM